MVLPDLTPLPADLALVLLDLDICIHTLAAEQLKVAVAAVSLLLLQGIHHCKVVLGAPAHNMYHEPCAPAAHACELQQRAELDT